MKSYERYGLPERKYVAEGLSAALLLVLRRRRLSVSDKDRERILAETSCERLERWLEQAVFASSIAQVLHEPPMTDADVSEEMMKEYELTNPFVKNDPNEGTALALATGILVLLYFRRLWIPDSARRQIRAETSRERLKPWLRRALTAKSVDEFLDESK